MEFVMNQNLVAWSCRGMCGTKQKIVVPCSSVLSCRVVSPMCELAFRVVQIHSLRQHLWSLNCCLGPLVHNMNRFFTLFRTFAAMFCELSMATCFFSSLTETFDFDMSLLLKPIDSNDSQRH